MNKQALTGPAVKVRFLAPGWGANTSTLRCRCSECSILWASGAQGTQLSEYSTRPAIGFSRFSRISNISAIDIPVNRGCSVPKIPRKFRVRGASSAILPRAGTQSSGYLGVDYAVVSTGYVLRSAEVDVPRRCMLRCCTGDQLVFVLFGRPTVFCGMFFSVLTKTFIRAWLLNFFARRGSRSTGTFAIGSAAGCESNTLLPPSMGPAACPYVTAEAEVRFRDLPLSALRCLSLRNSSNFPLRLATVSTECAVDYFATDETWKAEAMFSGPVPR